MIVRRALSSLILGLGPALWLQVHWVSAAWALGGILLLWAVLGAGSYLNSWDEFNRYGRKKHEKRLAQPFRHGPIIWLWKLVVTPWFQKEDGGPDGF